MNENVNLVYWLFTCYSYIILNVISTIEVFRLPPIDNRYKSPDTYICPPHSIDRALADHEITNDTLSTRRPHVEEPSYPNEVSCIINTLVHLM